MKLMLINYDYEYSKELYERFIKFKNIETIDCFTNGAEAIQRITHYEYDIVIFDMFLPEKDGIDILYTINILKYLKKPILIGLSGTTNKVFVHKYIELGIDYLFFKPFNSYAIESRLKLLIESYEYLSENCKTNLEMTQKNFIKDNLAQYKFKRSTLGYKYLVEAILLCIEDKNLLKNITKGLYFEIAKKYETTYYNVERGIRHLLKSQYKRNSDPFEKITDLNIKELTNSEFITYVVENTEYNLT